MTAFPESHGRGPVVSAAVPPWSCRRAAVAAGVDWGGDGRSVCATTWFRPALQLVVSAGPCRCASGGLIIAWASAFAAARRRGCGIAVHAPFTRRPNSASVCMLLVYSYCRDTVHFRVLLCYYILWIVVVYVI